METAPRRRGRPPRNRPEPVKPDILADQAHHAPPLSDYAQNLADEAQRIMNDEPIRAPMRPEMRAEAPRQLSSRELAEQRANEILGHLNGDLDDGVDRFHIPEDVIPPGWEYEWVRHSVYGREDPHYAASKARNGWTPVPTSRHPSMMPEGTSGAITLDGLILCERPKIISDRAREIEYRKAREQVSVKEQQLNEAPPGTFDRQAPNLRPTVKHGWEAGAMPIPD